MYCSILSGAVMGVHAYPVQVEVDVARGLPSFSMVGSLGSEVREARDRVWAALKNTGLEIPPNRITVNLSPADVRKEGTAFDLPIAVGLLYDLGYFENLKSSEMLFLGELGLDGDIRPVKGVLPIVREAAKLGIRHVFVPKENAMEGAVIPDVFVYGLSSIAELILYFKSDEEGRKAILPPVKADPLALFGTDRANRELDFCQVTGQHMAKKAATIAAAGFHNLLMVGPPGAGKSMIARRIPGILPPLSLEESLEVSSIYSVAGMMKGQTLMTRRPFQSPHHTISTVALTGGGRSLRPGLISLSHRGVLFLDELPEFQKSALEAMRQPLEDHSIQIARVTGNVEYPADFMLICAMNPCPCGFYPDRNRCKCTDPQIRSYLGKISGPILDRIDLCCELKAVDITNLQDGQEESSLDMQKRVDLARQIQKERYKDTKYRFNGDLTAADIGIYCELGPKEKALMQKLYHSMELSARSYHRIIKVARTVADLEGEESIREEHLLEAACYRPGETYF